MPCLDLLHSLAVAVLFGVVAMVRMVSNCLKTRHQEIQYRLHSFFRRVLISETGLGCKEIPNAILISGYVLHRVIKSSYKANVDRNVLRPFEKSAELSTGKLVFNGLIDEVN